MQKIVEIKKRDAVKQVATGIVYSPLTLDTQNDFMTAAGIEKAAHEFLTSGKTKNIDTNHDYVPNGSYVVESYISEGGTFAKGSWVVGVKIPDTNVWKAVQSGVLTGFSLAGKGIRKAATLGGKMANLIEDISIEAISLVSKPANQEKFMLKSDSNVNDMVTQISASLAQLTAVVNSLSSRVDAVNMPRSPQNLTKAQASIAAQDSAEIQKYESRLEHLHRTLEHLWDRPVDGGTNYALREARIREQIADAELELAVLRKGNEPSPWFQTGGNANFLQHGPTLPDDSIGIRKAASDEDSIDLDCMTLGVLRR